ncbi:RNA recognition motif domain containing protein, partial [Acanthamoeba castellanii str. Neff]
GQIQPLAGCAQILQVEVQQAAIEVQVALWLPVVEVELQEQQQPVAIAQQLALALQEPSSRPQPQPTPQPRSLAQPKKLHVGNLTRNVNEEHLREIFGQWGKLLRVELGWDRRIDQPKGFAYVEYDKYADSVEALKRMDG